MIIGFDVGGSKISLFLSERNGRVLYREKVPTPLFKTPMDLIEKLVDMSREAEERSESPVDIISVVFAGAVDGKSGIIKSSPNLFGGQEIPISSILEDILGKTVYIENDATAVAISEKIFGNGKIFSNFIYVTLSTGIGGGIFMNNRVYRGSNGMAGEFGHMRVVSDGKVCGCGRTGCFETVAGGRAIGEMLRTSGIGSSSRYLKKITDRPLEARDLFDGASRGDAECLDMARIFVDSMASGIASLANIFDPEAIMLGGGMANSPDIVFNGIREKVPGQMKTMVRNMEFFRTTPVTVELSPMAVVLYEEQIPGFNIERIVKEMREKISPKKKIEP